MKRTIVYFFLALLALLAVACSENPGTTTMRITIKTSADSSRTIVPDDSTLMDVAKYTISGRGPNGKIFTRNADSKSVEIEGLALGDWTVTAKGLNREGTELISGSTTFRLDAASGSHTIVLDTLVGTGNFRMVFDWSLCDVSSPDLKVFLSGCSDSDEEIPLVVTLNRDTRTAAVSETLASGSYNIRAILTDGSQQVAGMVEALRISNGSSTSGTYSFQLSEPAPATLTYLKDSSGTPIKGSLSVSGNPDTFLDGSTYSFLFTFTEPDKVSSDGLTIDWYYDGNLLESQTSLEHTGSSVSVAVQSGAHRIDAVVYNRLAGSTGSVSYSFTAVPDGQVGEMALLNLDAGTGIPMFDSASLVSPLPGDMFLVTTPNSAKMYICKVSSRSLHILKTYTSANFPWLNSVKHVFSDPEMNVLVATDNLGGSENFTCLYFNAGANTLEPITGMRFEGSVPAYGIPFTDFTAAAFNEMTDTIYLSDACPQGFDYRIRVSGSTASMAGTTRKKTSTYYNVVDMDISSNGAYSVSSSASSTSFVSARFTDAGTYVDSYESQSLANHPTKLRFVNNQTVAAGNANELTTFKVVNGGPYEKYRTVSMAVVDIQADGWNLFYVADANNRVISYEVSGNEIRELGFTTIDSPIRNLVLSGRYLIARTNANTLSLFEVIE